MKEPNTPMLRVPDWDRLYENNRSRDMKRTGWFPVPNDLSANSYVELVSHDDGPAHFGTWVALLMVASGRSRGVTWCGKMVGRTRQNHLHVSCESRYPQSKPR